MKTKLTLALVAFITSSAFAAVPKVLPEFKNAEQLAEWREEMAAKHAATTATDDHAFYTGKPYIESTGSYAFKCRSYNPELARWTSEDPSGFPDGANNGAYAPCPTTQVDSYGLAATEVDFSGSVIIPLELNRFLEGSAEGRFNYELDSNQIHFVGSGGGVYTTPLTGEWLAYTFTNKDTAVLELGSIRQTDNGIDTRMGENGITMKQDWIMITAHINLKHTTNLPDGTVFSGLTEMILTNYRTAGIWYE